VNIVDQLIWSARPGRGTFRSRFWTVPANRNPIGRRMAAAGIVR
jgi:hypothetical protein